MPDHPSQTDPPPASGAGTIRPLDATERRVLGVLIEKAKTTPDQYPLSLNALVTGCNQKSNRDPVMTVDEEQVMRAVAGLRKCGAMAEVYGSGKIPRYRHLAYEWLGVEKEELAILGELLLRGERPELRQVRKLPDGHRDRCEHQRYDDKEQQAQESSRKWFNRRMFTYFARFHEKFVLPIYPIVIFSYSKPKRAAISQYVVDFPDFKVLEFNYQVVQLNRLNWRDFLNQPNPVASALMAKMNIAEKERAKVKAECLRLLITLKLNPAKMQLISGARYSYWSDFLIVVIF